MALIGVGEFFLPYGLSDQVAFISGVYPNGTLPFYAYAAWNNDTPATYTGGYTLSAKFGAPTAGTAGGVVRYYFEPESNWSASEQQAFSASLWDPLESTCRHASLSIL